MLFVIEGVDRTGKTSLANRIADKIGGRVIHAGPPTRHPIDEYETALDGYHPLGEQHLVLDRWHVGEYVWPSIFSRTTQFNTAVQRHVEMFMRSRGAFIIHATRDHSRLATDLVANNEPLVPEKLAEADNLFEQGLVNSGTWGTWDYERDGDSRIDNFILNAMTYAFEVGRVWEEVGPGWVGNHRPLTLLVGDELGPEKENRNPPEDIPFAPYDATSGRYLMDSLTSWSKVALVNSLQGRNQTPRDLDAVWKAFGLPKVVALGKRASIALSADGVPHGFVNHPQYWRRFRYHELDEYSKLILEEAELA